VFTGLVESVGRVVTVNRGSESIEFEVEAPELTPVLSAGDSIAVDGVCQTVTAIAGDRFRFVSVPATLARTTFGSYGVNREVNLERALAAGQPMGGHIVQGHVDGVATIVSLEPVDGGARLRIRLPREVARVTVPRGSLAVDGVSLTVAELSGEVAEIAIIPYTWSHTGFPRLAPGATVNVEADLIGKYVEKLVRPHLGGES
jgi:riboflavin synthase